MKPPDQDVSVKGSSLVMDRKNRYWYTTKSKTWTTADGVSWWDILRPLGIHRESMSSMEVTVGNEPPRDREDGEFLSAPYKFVIDTENCGIILSYRWKDDDYARPMETRTSEIIWRAWWEEMTGALMSQSEESRVSWGRNHNVQRLRYIMSDNIVNTETKQIVKKAFKMLHNTHYIEDAGWAGERILYIEVFDDDERVQEIFNAFIGSRNMKGPARMLLDHSQALNGRRIVGIAAYEPAMGLPSLVFEIGDLPPGWNPPELKISEVSSQTKAKRHYLGSPNRRSYGTYGRSNRTGRYPKKSHRERSLISRADTSGGKAGSTIVGDRTDEQEDEAKENLYNVVLKLLYKGYPARTWPEIWARGNKIREMKPPKRDVSDGGSDIILNKDNNYKIKISRKDITEYFEDRPFLRDQIVTDGLLIKVTNVVAGRGIPGFEEADPKDAEAVIGSPYVLAMSEELRMIIIVEAFKNLDAGSPREERFSELLYRVWYQLGNDDLSHLDYIVLNDIRNQEFLQWMGPVHSYMERHGRMSGVKLDPESDDLWGQEFTVSWHEQDPDNYSIFNFLIACPIGAPISRMLQDHWNALEEKEIIGVKVVFDQRTGNYHMGYHLGRISENFKTRLRMLRKDPAQLGTPPKGPPGMALSGPSLSNSELKDLIGSGMDDAD
ncbi:hypothetical protein ABW21_db0200949 [Orbilia brochopaga]|nr:hypothetical protein ABW21_db0200949 [Drechslerella brochopaga]